MQYYANNDYRDYLSHYGILGMHWGIRRFQPYSAHPRKSGEGGKEVGEAKQIKKKNGTKLSRAEKKEIKKIQKGRKRNVKRAPLLSDRDLDTEINRLQKEQRFRELTGSNVKTGRNYVNGALGSAGSVAKQAATKIASAALIYVGLRYIEKRFGSDTANGIKTYIKKK